MDDRSDEKWRLMDIIFDSDNQYFGKFLPLNIYYCFWLIPELRPSDL